MSSGGPSAPIIRDFLYVDLGRARSMLAHADSGVLESVVERHGGSWDISARIGLSGASLGAGRTKSQGFEETRSLSDLHFSLLEEVAEATGLITDLSGAVDQPGDWHGGRVHSSLREAQLIRVTCPIRLIDSSYVKQSLDRVDRMMTSWAELMAENASRPDSADGSGRPAPTKRTNQGNQKQLVERRRRELLGGWSSKTLPAMSGLLDALLEGGISLRAMPCGVGSPECAFVGTLLERNEYIDPERSAIFGRLGVRPTEWTVVGIISRLTEEQSTEVTFPQGDFSRISIEQAVSALLDRLEPIGMSGSPTWPEISITPIAVYRPLAGSGPDAVPVD